MSERAQGTVSKWIDDKGYGFISVDGTHESVFVHYTDIEGEGRGALKVEERVEFTIQKSARGLRAVSLVRI